MSNRRVLLQQVFVLHRRPYRNTSMLIDIVSQDHGRYTVVGKGVRRPKQRVRAYLEPFQPLLMSWSMGSGSQDLGQFLSVEPDGPAFLLGRDGLYSAFYCNELLMRLLAPRDPHPEIFHLYHRQLGLLAQASSVEAGLRLFEKQLLAELGYGMLLDRDVNGVAVQAERRYTYLLEQGPVPADSSHSPQGPSLPGEALLAFSQNHLLDERILSDIKLLMRHVMRHYLGNKELKSRLLYQSVVS